MKIASKRQFFGLWRDGVLGNRTLLTEDLGEALSWKTKHIGFREIGRAGGGAWELAPVKDAYVVFARWKQAGRTFIMDGGVPNDKSTMQGEVCRTEKGIESFLCVRDIIVKDFQFIAMHQYREGLDIPDTVKEFLESKGLPPMRQSIARGLHQHRGYLETRMLLARYMDPSSRDDLDALLDLYPDASIEFTCFSVNVGVFPARNTIFWETRDY
jgi:hypothetical protein